MRIPLIILTLLPMVTLVTATQAQDSVVRRLYADGPYGQVHARVVAGPESTTYSPLICFHHTPGSSRHFDPFMRIVGQTRTVIAFDTPGYGQSDRPDTPITLEYYAAALGVALDDMGYGADQPVDMLGYLTGSFVATEFAVTKPALVRRLILISSPVWTDDERPGRIERWEQFETWSEDGSYVVNALITTLRQAKAEPPALLGYRLEGFVDGIMPGAAWDWAERAAIQYRAINKQPLVTQKTLALIMHDFPDKAAHRAGDLIRDVTVKDFRRADRFAFKQIPREIADEVVAFLDAPD